MDTSSASPSVDGNDGGQHDSSSKGAALSLEILGKDDLLAKCRSLLTISKKAKAAKDEAVAELEKVKGECKLHKAEQALALKNLEDECNKQEKNAEVLGEMVAAHSEEKVSLVTKIESLSRQLHLTSSVVESLQASELSLLEENKTLVKDIDKLIQKQKETEESVKKKESSWVAEKASLQQQIENLETQTSQIDLLKDKCKDLLKERTELETKLKDVISCNLNSKMELEAMKIMLEQTRAEKLQVQNEHSMLKEESEKLKYDMDIRIKTCLSEEKQKIRSDLDTQKNAMHFDNEKLHKEIDQLKLDLDELKKENECLQQTSSGFKEKYENLFIMYEDAVAKIKVHEREELHLKSEIEKYEEQVTTCKSESKKLTEELQKAVRGFEWDKAALTDSLQEQTAVNEKLRVELDKMVNKLKDAELKVHSSQLQCEAYLKEIGDKDSKLAAVMEGKEDMQRKLEKSQEQVKSLSKEQEKLFVQIEALSEGNDKLQELPNLLKERDDVLKQLNIKIASMQSELDNCTGQADIVKEKEAQILSLKQALCEIQEAHNVQLKSYIDSQKSLQAAYESLKVKVQKMMYDICKSLCIRLDEKDDNQVLEETLDRLGCLSDFLASHSLTSTCAKIVETLSAYRCQLDRLLQNEDNYIEDPFNELLSNLCLDIKDLLDCVEYFCDFGDSSSLVSNLESLPMAFSVTSKGFKQLYNQLVKNNIAFRKLYSEHEEVCRNLDEVIGAQKSCEEVIEQKSGEMQMMLGRIHCLEKTVCLLKKEKAETLEEIAKETSSEKLREWHAEKQELLTNIDHLHGELVALQLAHKEHLCTLTDAVVQVKDSISQCSLAQKAVTGDKERLIAAASEGLHELQQHVETSNNKCNHQEIWLLDNLQHINSYVKNLITHVESLHGELSETGKQNNRLKNDLEKSLESGKDSRVKLNVLMLELETSSSRQDELMVEMVQLKEKTEELQGKLNHSTETTERLEEGKLVLEKQLSEVHVKELRFQSSMDASSKRQDELLSELNEMNQVLRERGEKISRLETLLSEKNAKCEEMCHLAEESKAKLVAKEAELEGIRSELKTPSFVTELPKESDMLKDRKLEEMRKAVDKLVEEKAQLMKMLENHEKESRLLSKPDECQSENMSISTTSRVEEAQRMKEIEETFEERYLKLKSVAIKLKKKLAEQASQLAAAEEARKKLVAERDGLKRGPEINGKDKDQLVALSKNVQALHTEVDRIQDELDVKKKELKGRERELLTVTQEAADLKTKLASCEEDNAKLVHRQQEMEKSVREREEAEKRLTEVVNLLQRRIDKGEAEKKAVEDEMKVLNSQLNEEKQKNLEVNKRLEEVKQELKNCSLIDLEMKDYEKTVSEQAHQLKEHSERISDLLLQIEIVEGKCNSLEEQILHLAKQAEMESERAENFKKLSQDLKSKLNDAREELGAQMKTVAEEEKNIECLNQEIEKHKLNVAEMSQNYSRREKSLITAKEAAEKQVELLRIECEQLKSELQQLHTEVDSVNKEFEGYKLRAQNILKQKAKPPEQSIAQLKQERDRILQDLENSQTQINELQTEISSVRAEVGFLIAEKNRLFSQTAMTAEDLSKKETSYKERINCMKSEMDSKASEHSAIVRNLALQNKNLTESYETQLKTLKESHHREVEALQLHIEEAEGKLWKLQHTSMNVSMVNPSVVPSDKRNLSGVGPEDTKNLHRQATISGELEERLDFSSIVREEGEGSEWVESTPQHSPGHPRYSPPPLDKLIASLPHQVTPDHTESADSFSTAATVQEVVLLETQITSYKTRLHQVTTLLSEAESENAKLLELVDTLKEEIRRSTRSETREKHLENNEYIKNIILKFLALKAGEERARLIPVLKTILQLSTQETSQLQDLAGANDAASGSSGWGDYLHLWSAR